MGGSSGGGSSGLVDYPDYMKDWHYMALDGTGADTLSSSMTDAMDASLGNSPWTGVVAYDPAVPIAAYEARITAFAAILAGINVATDWDSYYTQAAASIPDSTDATGITEAVITADVTAFSNQIDDEITTKVLPRFRAGMRDINAVTSSAFSIGQSVIEGFRNREVAKHNSAIRLMAAEKNADIDIQNERLHNEIKSLRVSAANQILTFYEATLSLEDSLMKTSIEANRIKIVALKEEVDVNLRIDESDAKWDLEVFQYGSNLLAAIGSGTVNTQKQPSAAASAIGGAMSGAAAGAQIAGGTGAVVGGILGAASSLL